MNYFCPNGGDNYDRKSHRTVRLFHSKSEIAKTLLKASKIHQFTSTIPTSSSSDSEGPKEDEPPTKKACEMASSVPQLVRYDGLYHWPTFVPGFNNTSCKNEQCRGKTYWKCSKCNVYLCLHSARNCSWRKKEFFIWINTYTESHAVKAECPFGGILYISTK